MNSLKTKDLTINELSKNLVTYAVDRDDIKEILKLLPNEEFIDNSKIDYELQILKIVTVGWCISYCMENPDQKLKVSEQFWNMVNAFSKKISEMVTAQTEKSIDYFEIIKDRFDTYLKSMNDLTEKDDPVNAIGPKFADNCNMKDEVFTIMAGSRLYNYTISGVKEYLNYVNILDHEQ